MATNEVNTNKAPALTEEEMENFCNQVELDYAAWKLQKDRRARLVIRYLEALQKKQEMDKNP